MYGKIFESIYDGTIAVNWKAMIVFQQMIVLCDSEGVVDMTPPAISNRTRIPIDIIQEGLEFLSQPDEYSRSQAEEGRRIVLLDEHRNWGWRIVNHKHYRDLCSRDDKRQYDKKRYKSGKQEVKVEKQDISQSSTDSTHADAYTYTNIIKDMFISFWDKYPRKQAKKKSETAFNRLSKEKKQKAIEDCKTRYEGTEKRFIPLATTYIHGERWEDEIAPITEKITYPRRGDCNAWVNFAGDYGLKPNTGELQPSFEQRIINHIETKQ